jgi:hypothetical protein
VLSRNSLASSFVLGMFASGSLLSSGPTYKVVPIKVPAEWINVSVVGLNHSGQVVGNRYLDSSGRRLRPFIGTVDGVKLIPVPA